MKMNEDMRGLFYIVRGNYLAAGYKAEPEVECDDGVVRYLGGYDPTNTDTPEWYRVLDVKTRFCTYSGSSYEGALKCIEHHIKHFKSAKKYFKWLSDVSSEDYYFVKYLGHAPFTPDQVQRRAEGRQPRQSFGMKCLEKAIYEEFGQFYREDIEAVEDKVYDSLDMSTNVKKAGNKVKKLVKKSTKITEEKPVESKEKKSRNIIKPRVKLVTT